MEKNKQKKSDSIVLYEPDTEVFNDRRNFFLQNYTIPYLKEMAESLYPTIKKVEVKMKGAKTHKTRDVIELYKSKKGAVNKEQLVAFLSIFASDARNMSYYVNNLSEDVLKVMVLVIRKYIVSNTTLKLATGKSWVNKSGYSYEKSSDLAWFQCVRGKPEGYNSDYKYSVEHYFFMDVKILALFMPLFINREELMAVPLKELPEQPDEPLLTFKVDPQIFTELPILDGLFRQGYLTLNDKLKMPVSTLKKLAGQIKLPEFYPDELKQVANLRASLVLPFYVLHWNMPEVKNEQPEKIMRKLFQERALSNLSFLLPLLLPHVGGLKSIYIQSSIRGEVIVNFIGLVFGLVNSTTDKDWISFDQVLKNRMVTGELVTLFPYFQLNTMVLNNKLHGYPIYLDSSFEEISVSFYKGFFFLLASFGLVEIAYTQYDDSAPSPFSSLRYFRMTTLGLYVFGFIDSYTVPENENKEALFELDENNLIVRSLTDANPYESLLAEMAEPIGRKRYRVTHASLLNSCNTQMEVANKIDFFKHFISDKLPDVWDKFFQSLVLRCKPLNEEQSGKYLVYRLDPSNRELLQLLSTDPMIRKYTLRAEGHLLLVEAAHLKEVVTRLKYFGYLL